MARYFGTDGIRGSYGDARINPDFAYRLGSALGCHLARQKPGLPLNAVIGRDTRKSGLLLCQAITQGLNRHGVYVHDTGIVPTPAVARAVLLQASDIGIAITASHNPAADNGMKLFNAHGFKYDESSELEIEALIDAQPHPTGNSEGYQVYPYDASGEYVNYIRSLMNQNCLDGWKVVLDLSNGATCQTTPAAFRQWGAELHLIGNEPNGENINAGVGSEHPQMLGAKVRECGAQIGIAHDGDGDRLVVCDEKGEVLEGEVLLGLFGLYALRSGTLSQKTLVTTVHSNLGLDRAIAKAGGRVERVSVGDRHVASRMREIGSNIGGESSGHYILSDFSPTGDGLIAVVKLIDLICKVGRPLSELRKEVSLFPRQFRNLSVREKRPIEDLPALSGAIRRSSEELGGDGRVLVRYSGTEPMLRLLVEGVDHPTIARHMASLVRAARLDLEIIDS